MRADMTEAISSYLFRAVSPVHVGLKMYSGFLVRGIFFRMLRAANPELATSIHDMRALSPYSLSPLETVTGREIIYDMVPGGVAFQFRIAALSKPVAETIQKYFLRQEIATVDLIGTRSFVKEVEIKTLPQQTSVDANVENAKFEVDFRSPTFFRSSQRVPKILSLLIPRRLRKPVKPIYRYVIVPDPYHFFRSLARLYRQFCNPGFRYRSYCEWLLDGGVALETYYGLRVMKLYDSVGRWSRGFVGKAVFTIPEDLFDKKMAQISLSLLEFARFSNVGGNRTAGFGVVDFRIRKADRVSGSDSPTNSVQSR
ncbi:MAG: CRISPR system precrRNA processing endoribonuclease RAMP protein Cas6 [Nitrososphaerota archaeon]